MAVYVKEYTLFRENEIRPLYAENGWESYLRKADLLENAYAHSLKTLAAYDGDKLVGIIRAVGDGVSILYIQVEKAGCVSFIRLHPCYQSLNPERADFPE